MTDAEMAAMVRNLVNEPRFDAYTEAYLELAKGAVVERLFPFQDRHWADVPEKHHPRTVEIAVYLVNRRGGEGETNHSESGVSRSYESAGIPESYFDGMTSKVGVPS